MAVERGRKGRPYPLQMPASPASTYSSASPSPAIPSFSPSPLQSKLVSSSVSSLVTSPGSGMGVTMERTGSLPIPLCDVKEESNQYGRDIEDDYFGFNQVTLEPEEMVDEHYDLTDHPYYADYASPTRRRSGSLSSRGLSRFSSRVPSVSRRWKSTQSSDGTYNSGIFSEGLRSRAESAASSTSQIVPVMQEPQCALPSSRNSQEKSRHSDHSLAISIEKANRGNTDEQEIGAKPSTPLLPPIWSEFQTPEKNSGVASPLQSPSVADVFDDDAFPAMASSRTSIHRSPPLSSKPSVTSLANRARGMTLRTTISGEGAPPLLLHEEGDEWSSKLGHANFTIQPEPYIPEASDAMAFRKFRDDWDLARTNYAKHLVRTGEHYGETSMIYYLTKQKWESIEQEWKANLEFIVTSDVKFGAILGLTKSNMSPAEDMKIPRLHDNEKFPELGDEEIVGPMTVAPAIHTVIRCKSPRRRNVFRFLQDLVGRGPPGIPATRA